MNALDVTARGLAARAAQGMSGVPISDYGPTGTHDDSLVFQAAIDDLESTSKLLELVGPLNLRGTVYLGTNAIRFNGWPINCLIDGDFTERAAIPGTMDAVIGTKSGWYSSYGSDAVAIDFVDEATFNVVRTVDDGVAALGIKLEGTRRFSATRLTINTTGTGNSALSSLDMFQGVKGVLIDTLVLSRHVGLAPGGCWIRSFASWTDTCDISIGRIVASGDGIDEFVSIFNSGGDAGTDVHDVRIGEVIASAEGGAGWCLSIYRAAGKYDPTKMRNITIGSINLKVRALSLPAANAIQTLKFVDCAPSIGEVSVAIDCAFPANMTDFTFLRGPTPGSQDECPRIGSLHAEINYANATPPGSVASLSARSKLVR